MLTRLVDEREIFILPVVNPDGYVYNEMIAPDGGGMWRKNRNPEFAPDYGVDLNRNYGYMWGYNDFGSSPDPSDATYRGTAPFSEPETANIRAFVNSHEFVFAVNYHSHSDLILWSFDGDVQQLLSHGRLETLPGQWCCRRLDVRRDRRARQDILIPV